VRRFVSTCDIKLGQVHTCSQSLSAGFTIHFTALTVSSSNPMTISPDKKNEWVVAKYVVGRCLAISVVYNIAAQSVLVLY
jgi:hypothetical protein